MPRPLKISENDLEKLLIEVTQIDKKIRVRAIDIAKKYPKLTKEDVDRLIVISNKITLKQIEEIISLNHDRKDVQNVLPKQPRHTYFDLSCKYNLSYQTIKRIEENVNSGLKTELTDYLRYEETPILTRNILKLKKEGKRTFEIAKETGSIQKLVEKILRKNR